MTGESSREAGVCMSRRSFAALAFATPALMLAAAPHAVRAAGLSASADGERASSAEGEARAASSQADAAGEATAEANKKRRYEDIPADALITAQELHDVVESGAVDQREVIILDIRSHRDYQNQMIAGSRNIPAGRQIDIRMSEIPQDKEIVLVALKSSNRLAETWYTLTENGYDPSLVKVLDGGLSTWVAAGYPTLEDQFLGC